jgi:cortactin
LHEEVKKEKQNEQIAKNFSTGYGGKYGVQHDRVDKSAVGFDYKAELDKHSSQKGLFFKI